MVLISRTLLFLVLAATAGAHTGAGKVKVFILSGQSNMVGWAHTRTLGELGKDPESADPWGKLRNSEGAWTVREDVFIRANIDDRLRHGALTVGFGGQAKPEWIGPELMFGIEMGDRFEEPVLLIKAAWGGKDLYCDFRPPSAGAPSYEIPMRDGKPREVGAYYRKLVAEVRQCLQERDELFPSLAGLEFELSGFVWLQGWNEMYAGHEIQDEVYGEYASNYTHLFDDLRAEFDAPGMVSVVGELGIDGERPSVNVTRFRAAQRRIQEVDALRRNTLFVPTVSCWDEKAESVRQEFEKVKGELSRDLQPSIREGLAQELEGKTEKEQRDLLRRAVEHAYRETSEFKLAEERWEAVGSHWLCHYNGSAKAYCLVGLELARGMNSLLK